MLSVTNKDYSEVLNLIYLINQCENEESFVEALFPAMMQIFASECATFQILQGYPREIKIIKSRAFKSDNRNLVEDTHYPAQYNNHGYFNYSPLLKQAISTSKTILNLREFISTKDWERSDFYNNFILPQRLYRELFIALRWKNNLEGMITLWRSKKQPDFEKKDNSKAEILAPNIVLAMHKAEVVSTVNRWKNHLITAEGVSPETSLRAKFHLTKRELEIINLLLQGMSGNGIANKLFISELTVHTHIKNIYWKIGAKNRIELYRCIQSAI